MGRSAAQRGRHHRRGRHRREHRLPPGRARQDRRDAGGAQEPHQRQHLARGRAGRPAAEQQQPHPAHAQERRDLPGPSRRRPATPPAGAESAACASPPAPAAGRNCGASTRRAELRLRHPPGLRGRGRRALPAAGHRRASTAPPGRRSDGYVDPSQLTFSFIAGARAAGVQVVAELPGDRRRAGRPPGHARCSTEQGRIECDVAVNATGMWGAETARARRRAPRGQRRGAPVRRHGEERRHPARPADVPRPRRPVLPQAGGRRPGHRRLGGGHPRLLAHHPVRPRARAVQAGPRAVRAARRGRGAPGSALRRAGHPHLGQRADPVLARRRAGDGADRGPGQPVPLLRVLGRASRRRAAPGDAMANWIIDGDPGMDLWPFDVRRFGAPHNVPAVLEALSVQAYGHYYDIAYPNRPAHPPRGQRRSAVYDRLDGARRGVRRQVRVRAGQLVRATDGRRSQARDADLRAQRGLAVHRGRARGRPRRPSASSTRARS